MASITLQNVAVTAGAMAIVKNVTLNISMGDRIALVGPNGMGKTSLLRVITGELEPAQGSINHSPNTSVIRLEQWRPAQLRTIYDAAYHANPHIQSLEQQLHEIEREMAQEKDASVLDKLVERWGMLSEAFQMAGGYEWEARVKMSLQKLGFSPERWQDQPQHLSGGEAHRLALLQVILSGRDVWLLDEPTNHLDIEAITWLEDTVRQADQAMIIVSHDRAFLDAVATRTMSWEDGWFWVVNGNWTHYERLRQERLRIEAVQWQRQQEEEQRLRQYIDRWRSGTRARQAQSRLKRLDSLVKTKAPAPIASTKVPALLHQGQEKVGHLPALKIEQLALQRGSRFWQPITLAIPLQARIALIGPNGTGKTTLLEALLEDPHCHWHPEVTPAYLAQSAVQNLPDDLVALDYAFELGWEREQAYYFGARFGIDQELWSRPLGTWSGGERVRLQLIETLTTPAQALLLDEPTNHLDIRMREALERLLQDYPGTLIVASHDRAFLQSISTHTWWSDGERFIFDRRPYRLSHQSPKID